MGLQLYSQEVILKVRLRMLLLKKLNNRSAHKDNRNPSGSSPCRSEQTESLSSRLSWGTPDEAGSFFPLCIQDRGIHPFSAFRSAEPVPHLCRKPLKRNVLFYFVEIINDIGISIYTLSYAADKLIEVSAPSGH